jgi:adenylate cyclase
LTSNLYRKLAAGLLIGLGAAMVVLAVRRTGALERIELATYDWRLRLTAEPATARDDIVLVEINESSLRQLEPAAGRWPWPRAVHAGVIDFLARAPARVIAYDVLFLEPDRRSGFPFGGSTWSGEESDAALVNSTRRAGTVIHLADATFEGLIASAGGPPPIEEGTVVPGAAFQVDAAAEERPELRPPFGALAMASRALAHNFLVLEHDGPVRRVIPFVRQGTRALPSLGVAAAIAAERVPVDQVTTDGRFVRVGTHRMALTTVRVPGAEESETSLAAAGRRTDRGVIVGSAQRTTRTPEPREGAARTERGRGPASERAGGAAGAEPPGSQTTRPQRGAYVAFRGPALLPDGVSRPYRSYAFYDLLYSEEQILAGEPPHVDPAVFRDKIVFVGTTAAGLADTFQTPFGSSGKMPGIQYHASVADGVLSSRFIAPAGAGSRWGWLLGLALLVGILAAFLRPLVSTIAALACAALFAWVAAAAFRDGVWLTLVDPALGIALALFAGVGYQYAVEGREKRKVKRLFGHYVPRDVYEQLLADPSLARLGGRRRAMTVLFSDIRGFTTASERDRPEAIVAQLNEYFSRMVEILFRHQGTLDKFIGDGVMALFGAPLDDPDHADHAVAAAIEMVGALGELNRAWAAEGRPPFDIGIGINSGEMIAGNIGSQAIMSYTAIGDAVNLGARLESLNKEFGTRIIISEATRALLHGAYTLRPLGEASVKGRQRAVKIHEVVA